MALWIWTPTNEYANKFIGQPRLYEYEHLQLNMQINSSRSVISSGHDWLKAHSNMGAKGYNKIDYQEQNGRTYTVIKI